MRVTCTSQWAWPLLDFDLVAAGVSWFGPHDYFNCFWSGHITLLGFTLVVMAKTPKFLKESK